MQEIQGINRLYAPLVEGPKSLHNNEQVSAADKNNFASALNTAIGSLDQKQFESNEAIQALAEGKADDMHSVMIKTTEAQLSLELAVQMRNKVLEAYNEVKNIQF